MTSTDPEPGSGTLRTVLRTAFEGSTLVEAVRMLPNVTRRFDCRESSAAWRLLEQYEGTVSAASSSSVATQFVHSHGNWTRASFLYRWLTREPEPEVIVIDLRETVTVGPVIAGLDRLSDILRPAIRRSRLARTASIVEDGLRRQPVRTASLLLLAGAIVSLVTNHLLNRPPQLSLVIHGLLIAAAALGTRVTTPWKDLRDARTIRLLAAVLEPPVPVDQSARTVDEERPATETDRE